MNNSHSSGRPDSINCDAECDMKSGSIGVFVENLSVAFSSQYLLVFIVVTRNTSFILTIKKMSHIKYKLLNINLTELNTLDGLWMANFNSSVDKIVTT